ncbi:MAG: hypothetical protein ABSG70_08395 [Terriglobales bacterium]
MELFLNLCWLALLLPAYALWQRRTSSDRSQRGSLIFVSTLGCVLVLLFPVISASDDLHAISQAMEESKPSVRGDHCTGAHSADRAPQLALHTSDSPRATFEQVGTVPSFAPHSHGTLFASAPTGRAPPRGIPVSL